MKQHLLYSKDIQVNIVFLTILGAGILALPYAFDSGGYILSSVVFLIIALMIYDTMNMLFKIADSYNKPGLTYPMIAELNYGSKGIIIVKSLLVLF